MSLTEDGIVGTFHCIKEKAKQHRIALLRKETYLKQTQIEPTRTRIYQDEKERVIMEDMNPELFSHLE